MTDLRSVFTGKARAAVLSMALILPGVVPVPARAQAVERVTEVRRILRSACVKLQSALAGEEERAAWMAQATAQVEEGDRLWAALLSEFPAAGPGPYAALPEWGRATDEIRAGIEEVLARARAGDATPARTACGQNCGRFTALNERAGLELAPDALFRFRQAAKPLADLIAKEDRQSVGDALLRLEELRSRAMEWPATGPLTHQERAAALEAFSARVDAFAEAFRAGRDVAAAYAAMMEALERAYDAVL